ncbi:hypothetical protein PRIPAC_93617 [Pristionchus pacificus]|uniref:Uncharacterized protein n=1 Tax=Pristionchus pacificus TaxID=54126 RepID=A0A454Y2X4_PRIPA|nr:hypothetical protein PRIPAC_93617 [Pristionchus pacificus]|eukprot:PDM68326.1 hypothetical protein PRIPAC_46370 [Pristionchus pacificus]
MKLLVLFSLLDLALTVTAAPKGACCGNDIVLPNYRNQFKPPLKECPLKTTFLCSGSKVKILYENASNAIRNPAAELTCRKSDGKWTTSDGRSVDKISCDRQ